MIPPGARVDTWAPIHAPGIAPTSSDAATASEKSPNTQVPGGGGAHHRDRLDEVRADERRRHERRGGASAARRRRSTPRPTDVSPTMNPATAPSMSVGIGRRTTAGRLGTPATPSPSGRCVAPHLEQRPDDEPARSRRSSAIPSAALEQAVEVGVGRHEADEPRPRERRRHGPDAQPPDDAQVHRPAPQVDERADRLHEQRHDDVARDRGQRVDAEEEHQHRRHEGAAAHPGEADDRAHEQPADGEREVEGHVRHGRPVAGPKRCEACADDNVAPVARDPEGARAGGIPATRDGVDGRRRIA